MKKGGGQRILVFGSLFSLIMAFFLFSVMSEFNSFSVADDTIFSASQPVNSAFAQLTGPKTLATKRWGSVLVQ